MQWRQGKSEIVKIGLKKTYMEQGCLHGRRGALARGGRQGEPGNRSLARGDKQSRGCRQGKQAIKGMQAREAGKRRKAREGRQEEVGKGGRQGEAGKRRHA
jgi:hypothetical protein